MTHQQSLSPSTTQFLPKKTGKREGGGRPKCQVALWNSAERREALLPATEAVFRVPKAGEKQCCTLCHKAAMKEGKQVRPEQLSVRHTKSMSSNLTRSRWRGTEKCTQFLKRHLEGVIQGLLSFSVVQDKKKVSGNAFATSLGLKDCHTPAS